MPTAEELKKAADKKAAEKASGEEVRISEEDLLKSLQDLEKKAEDQEPEPIAPAKEVIETATLEKSATEEVEAQASEALKKSLNENEGMKEVVNLLGVHIDTALETIAKSVNAAAERDNQVIKVLTKFNDDIVEMQKKIEAYGDTPAPGKTEETVTTPQKTEVLEKNAQEPQKTANKLTQDQLNKKVQARLDIMCKKYPAGSEESLRYMNAAIKFEATQTLDPMIKEELLMNQAA